MAELGDGFGVRWNPDGWALAADGVSSERGRWEYWVDDELMLWWGESDRVAFRSEQVGDGFEAWEGDR